jgi:hypothetical protein
MDSFVTCESCGGGVPLRATGLWVKCQDEVQSGKQCWSHIEIRGIAADLGLSAKDLFILVGTPRATRRHLRQQHARKTHSYLWIFERQMRRGTPRSKGNESTHRSPNSVDYHTDRGQLRALFSQPIPGLMKAVHALECHQESESSA